MLGQAEPHLARAGQPRLVFAARSSEAYCLSVLERHKEAERCLQDAWRVAEPAAGELDRLRLVWTGARVAAGTGQVSEGIAAMEQVRRDFAARGMAYDAALASLELAAVYLEQGATARVRDLVHEMLPSFQSRAIHREAQAALRLFQQSVEQDRATAALVRHLVAFLHRARHNPDLRMELPAKMGPAQAAGQVLKGSPPSSRRKGS